MQTLTHIAPYVALAAAALALVVLALVLVIWKGLRQLRRSQAVVLGHHEDRDIVAAAEALDTQVRNMREAVEILTDQLDERKAHLDHALTNRAIVRYDAFRDAAASRAPHLPCSTATAPAWCSAPSRRATSRASM